MITKDENIATFTLFSLIQTDSRIFHNCSGMFVDMNVCKYR